MAERFIAIMLLAILLINTSASIKSLHVDSSSRSHVRAMDWCGHHRVVALTFDDGPHPLFTPPLLDVLKEAGIPATFFISPDGVRRVEEERILQCEIIGRMIEEGHDVQVHTWDHKNIVKEFQSFEELERSIKLVQEMVYDCSGNSYIPRMFRPPFGSSNGSLTSMLYNTLGLTTMSWNIDSNDWRFYDPRESLESFTEKIISGITHAMQTTIAHGGSASILFHDKYPFRLTIKKIFQLFEHNKYEFVTATKCLEMCEHSTDGQRNCWSNNDPPSWPGVYPDPQQVSFAN